MIVFLWLSTAFRSKGITINQYRGDPKLAAKVLTDAAFTYGYDCIIIDFDTCTRAKVLGAELEFLLDGMATVTTLSLESISQLADSPIPDPEKDERMPLWLVATRASRIGV